MSLSQPTPFGPRRLWDAPLVRTPSALVRARSRALREIASRVLPQSMLFVHGSRQVRRKCVALTFDDGPDTMTAAYLDVMDDLGIRATFFLIGEQAARYPQAAREYIRRGHEVGGHGWTHDAFSELSTARLGVELDRMSAALPPHNGGHVLIRPPRGILSPRTLMNLASAGYTTVLWSVDSDDCRTRDPQVIEQRLAPSRVAPGDVILMHEMQEWTLEALPRIVVALRRAGYELVTVGDLMKERADARV